MKLEENLNTLDDNVVGFFIGVDLKYPANIKEKTTTFPLAPLNKPIDKDKYNDYMKKIQSKDYTKSKKLICDWSEKKKCLIHYGILKFFVRHGMIVEKFMKLFHLNRVSG